MDKAKVNSIAETSEVQMSDLRKSIIDLSNQIGISSSAAFAITNALIQTIAGTCFTLLRGV